MEHNVSLKKNHDWKTTLKNIPTRSHHTLIILEVLP